MTPRSTVAATTSGTASSACQWFPEWPGGEHAVAVGPEAEEGDVAQVEQPRVPDHDVEAEREQSRRSA